MGERKQIIIIIMTAPKLVIKCWETGTNRECLIFLNVFPVCFWMSSQVLDIQANSKCSRSIRESNTKNEFAIHQNATAKNVNKNVRKRISECLVCLSISMWCYAERELLLTHTAPTPDGNTFVWIANRIHLQLYALTTKHYLNHRRYTLHIYSFRPYSDEIACICCRICVVGRR